MSQNGHVCLWGFFPPPLCCHWAKKGQVQDDSRSWAQTSFTLNHQQMTCVLTDMWADRISEQNPFTLSGRCKITFTFVWWWKNVWLLCDNTSLIKQLWKSSHTFYESTFFDELSKFWKGFWWFTPSIFPAVFPASFTSFPPWLSWSASILAVYKWLISNICSNARQTECYYLSHEWNQQVF